MEPIRKHDIIAIRHYQVEKRARQKPLTDIVDKIRRTNTHSHSLVLVLDTETTTDQFQNLKFGSAGLYANGDEVDSYLFYDEGLEKKDIETIKAYGAEHGMKVLPSREFIDNVFFLYVYVAGAVCVGFNLPFDLSRFALRIAESSKYKNGFSFTLSDHHTFPELIIKHKDSKGAFIEFAGHWKNNKKSPFTNYRGYFQDLRTLVFSLTNQGLPLETALIVFECTHRKQHPDEHGVITPEYIDYNVNDTRATHELYEKAMARYKLHGLEKEPNQIFSPAGIGKAYLEQIGIKPFLVKNPRFPNQILGYTMETYFGGRAEVRIRKTPTKITYIDFTSMYPSLNRLLRLDRFQKAERIHAISNDQNTAEVRRLLQTVTKEGLQDPALWEQLTTICQVKPDGYLVPVRARYGNKYAFNIGVNFLTSTDDTTLWYTVEDLIATKIYTGRFPVIEDAITFKPSDEVQDGLNEITILPDIILKPDEDLIKKLIEERMRIKEQIQTTLGAEKQALKVREKILKIIANATAYGIFIQLDPEEKNSIIEVYGQDMFEREVQKVEKPGPAFNPIMAVFITSGAKLILAMAEKLLMENGGYMAYCDTDSLFISPQHEELIQKFFRPLNPYEGPAAKEEMFKVEKNEYGKPLRNVWFYGISAKRYVLYYITPISGEIRMRKMSLHGLGHLSGIDEEEVWQDILTIHYHPSLKKDILRKWGRRYAVTKYRISGYDVWARCALNQDICAERQLREQIKPFNFVLVGTSVENDKETGKPIIPLVPYTSDDRELKRIHHKPFTDFNSGKKYADPPTEGHYYTREYWKPMSEVIEDYVNHKERKSEGDIGRLRRRHLYINKDSIIHIGKESNEIEESFMKGLGPGSYTVLANIARLIPHLDRQTALRIGFKPRTYSYMVEKAEAGDVKALGRLHKDTIRRLKDYLKIQ